MVVTSLLRVAGLTLATVLFTACADRIVQLSSPLPRPCYPVRGNLVPMPACGQR